MGAKEIVAKRVLRVFPRRTAMTPDDDLAFVGDPPLFIPRPGTIDEVHVSCVFTWDKDEAERLGMAWSRFYPSARLRVAGPVYEQDKVEFKHCTTLPPSYRWAGEFTPGLYVKQGVTFTSRGCPNWCAHCLVPDREGGIRELEVKAGNIVQDNNILATSRGHFRKVCAMLKAQRRLPQFRGGLEAARLTDWHVEQLRGLRLPTKDGLWFACDREGADRPLARAVGKLADLPRRTLRCYVLCGFGGDTVEKAAARLERVWEIGCLPFAQLYQPADKFIEYGPEWKALAREWMRPAAMFANHADGGG